MASILSLLTLSTVVLFMACPSSPALSSTSHPDLPTSAISAAPALLPYPPLSSPPALSPDIAPLLPSPGGGGAAPSPALSSLPTIPSNPSPPNPDAPRPDVIFPPPGFPPASTSVPPNSVVVLFLAAAAFWLMQLYDMCM